MYKNELIRMLSQRKIEWLELNDASGRSVFIAPALGGRIVGVFFGGANFLWLNENLPGDWNCGGHRTWIAPEWQDKSFYLKPDRCSWFVDNRLDPGCYKVTHHEHNAMVEMTSNLDMTAVDGTHYLLSLRRKVSLVPSGHVQRTYHPQSPDSRTMKSVCISFEHGLKNCGNRALQQELSLWSILQVCPRGVVLVPVNNFEGKFFYEYYEPLPSERLLTFEGCAAIFVDGARRYKLGFPPSHTRGAIGYLSRLCPDTYVAIIKFFFYSPDGRYIDKPQGDKRKNGDVIQLYNHSEGGAMAFAELECHAPAQTLMPEQEQSFGIDMLLFQAKKMKYLAGLRSCCVLAEPRNL